MGPGVFWPNSALARGVEQRSIRDGPRYRTDIGHRVGPPGHRVTGVYLLDHADDDDVVGWIDPEPGAVHAAPVIATRADGAAVEIGPCRIEHDAHPHAIADARERLIKTHRNTLRQQVARHQLDRRRRQNPGVVEHPTIGQHLRETNVVLRRCIQPGDREQVSRLLPRGDASQDRKWRLVRGQAQREVLVERVTGRDAVAVFQRDAKAGVFHAQRPEDAPFEEGVQRLTGYSLDDYALKLLLEAVPEQRAG